MSTLAGLDEHDGEIVGWGLVTAAAAREVAARQHSAMWQYVIADVEGRLLLTGTIRCRPADATPTPAAETTRGVVEVQVDIAELAALAAAPPAGWEPLVADLARQWAERDDARRRLDERPDDRFPHTALRRHVEVRDRTCVFPGCRRPSIAYVDGW